MGYSLIRGKHKVGSTLTGDTVRVADVNGLTNPRFEYQPQRVDHATQTDIPGAVSKTYTLTDEDVDKRVQLQVQFADNNGHHETRSGPATSTMTPDPARRKVKKLMNLTQTSQRSSDVAQIGHDGGHLGGTLTAP